ncbi:MAG: DUF445 family protein [Opitutales bacterium]|nr:DUF445 family protein [Opitutales bacterium]
MIGWLTNWLAIRMLFHPRQPIRFFHWRWQGLVPRRQVEIAEKVGDIVEREILQKHVLREELDKLPIDQWLNDFSRRLVQERLAPKIRQMPVIGAMINQRVIAWVEESARKALAEEAPLLMGKIVDELEARIAIRHMVTKRVAEFDLDALERIVRDLAHKEFKRIEWLGAILGFLIGMVQALLAWLAMG